MEWMAGKQTTNDLVEQLLPMLLRRAAQCVTDGDGKIVWSNRAFRERLGFPSHEALDGMWAKDLIGQGVDAGTTRSFRRADGSTFRAVCSRRRVRARHRSFDLWTLGRVQPALLHLSETAEEEPEWAVRDLELSLLRTLHELAAS